MSRELNELDLPFNNILRSAFSSLFINPGRSQNIGLHAYFTSSCVKQKHIDSSVRESV